MSHQVTPPMQRLIAAARGEGLSADHRRRRLVALAAAGGAALAIAVVAVVLATGGGATPPATGAARLVPADALVYVHLSTDSRRDGVRRALDQLDRFPSFPRVRTGLLQRLSALSTGVSFQRDVRPWLGKEAALALLNTRTQTAGSLLVFGVANRAKARAFLRRVGGPAGSSAYRGTQIVNYGNVAAAFVGSYLVIAPVASVQAAIDARAGRVLSLARAATYRRASRGLPAGRLADVYASPDGVARVLAPQGGALGAAGALLDQPALAGVALSLSGGDHGVELQIHSIRDAARARRLGVPPQPAFTPRLLGSVPANAMAYIGLTRLDRAGGRLLTAGLAGGGAGARITGLLQRAQRDLQKRTGVNLRRDVLPLFQGEVALWLAPATPAPILTLISAAKDEQATREAFARLQEPLARLLAPPSPTAPSVPAWQERDLGDGVQDFQLRIAPGIELDYAVFDGKLVASTALAGVRAVKDAKHRLSDDSSFSTTLGNRPDKVTSLVFLNFSALLALGERTGLSDSRAYLAVRDDLRKVKAVGAAAAGSGDESTTKVSIQIK
jgi:Protein of unknown function (DUF3352)